jgi:4-hydroxybenzoate polyprenyltransferase
MPKWLNVVANFIRWRDWGPGKVPVLCVALFYVGLTSRRLSPPFILDVVLFVVYATLHSALGYAVNDWGDRELDAHHGKPNAFASLTHTRGIAALAVLLGLAFLSGLPFVRRPMMLPLWAGWAFFALSYSLRPLRLKERGAWGLGFSFVAQWSLPVLLAFAALDRFGGWDMMVFAVAITISGATLEIAHQRWDRVRDRGTQTGTLGARTSAVRLDRLFAVALFLDKIAWGVILVTLTLKLAPVTLGPCSLSPALPLLALYALLFAAALYEAIRASQRGELLDPYYSSRRSIAKLLHETMPNLIVPVYLMMLATAYQPVNGVLLLAFLSWRLVLGRADWRWPLRIARDWWRNRRRPEAGS